MDLSFHVSCQKITLEELSDSKSMADEKSMKSAEHSVNSLATATHETSNVAVYEVWHSYGGVIKLYKKLLIYLFTGWLGVAQEVWEGSIQGSQTKYHQNIYKGICSNAIRAVNANDKTFKF